ncbi:Transcriptional regulatory protein glnR [Microbacterium esteraromaticum]|uniref:Transcriptional regulatory protein glnR n=1 Tax=Microbacterium esteraromaticum TaxID=57043 RepID=A0A1R4I6T8_9MICO|nr:response regulator transcription factor [Microbacterium esteraromaticum]SJN15406.1 Transcriptional regulatory protein glnR [Microbacterium esteraromaticum]
MVLLLTLSSAPDAESVLPALALLSHSSRQHPLDTVHLLSLPESDAILIDARTDLVGAKAACRLLRTAGSETPILLVVSEGGLSAVSAEWGFADVLLTTAGPAEIDARIRLAVSRAQADEPVRVSASGITIDEQSYAAKLRGRPLDLTYKEFQLLHFLATHPSRVFTREQLLTDVWGYDYFGGTRTVDVHVRRLRAKLGDSDQIIGTVRNVGYRFNLHPEGQTDPE